MIEREISPGLYIATNRSGSAFLRLVPACKCEGVRFEDRALWLADKMREGHGNWFDLQWASFQSIFGDLVERGICICQFQQDWVEARLSAFGNADVWNVRNAATCIHVILNRASQRRMVVSDSAKWPGFVSIWVMGGFNGSS